MANTDKQLYMRRLRFLLVLLVCLSCISVSAQTAGKNITGSVTANNQKAVESATITLVKAKDSSVVKIAVADQNGNYHFENIPEGDYLVIISAVGYQSQYAPAILPADSSSITIKPMLLTPEAKALASVEVIAKRPPVEVRAGKTVVNVDASPTNAGLNVLEILEKSPGVAVDNDGNVSLKGKNGVLILIDGKQTYLTGTQLASFFKKHSIQRTRSD